MQFKESPAQLSLLDPTLDVVFKLLLLRNEALLRDMIESVLNPPSKIASLVVLNPEIPKDAPGDKCIVLDIRVRLEDGWLIDLEMQSTVPPGTGARFLCYWARNLVDSIGRGDDYTRLRPCISILWFKLPLLDAERFHSKFVVADLDSGTIFSDLRDIHVLELPKLHLARVDRQAKLERWARFLRATTVKDLEQLASEDPIMNAAKNTLEELSMDPEARRIATDREVAVLMHRHLMAASREEGWAAGKVEGREEGLAEGKAEGVADGEAKALARAIPAICSILSIELDAERQRWLASLDLQGLRRMMHQLETERRWPSE